MSNGAGKDYGGALLISAREMQVLITGLEQKLLITMGALREISVRDDVTMEVSMIALEALEAAK